MINFSNLPAQPECTKSACPITYWHKLASTSMYQGQIDADGNSHGVGVSISFLKRRIMIAYHEHGFAKGTAILIDANSVTKHNF